MAETAPSSAESVHLHLVKAAQILQGSESALRNQVSSHKIKNPVSFQALDTFCVNATKPGGATASQLYLASLDGGPVISARLRLDSEPSGRNSKKKKRGRDDAAERAEAACAKLKRMSQGPRLAQVELAQKTIEELLRIEQLARDEARVGEGEKVGALRRHATAADVRGLALSRAPPARRCSMCMLVHA